MTLAQPRQTDFLPETGEMAQRCRNFDWSTTPLGPVDGWPQSLRTAAAVVLRSGFPSILVWGPELVQIYNDAYVHLIGTKHPSALGMPTHECWPEIRHVQEPIFTRVFNGETVNLKDAHYALNRTGTIEDAYFDATFIPVPLEDDQIGGSLSTLFETTEKVKALADATRGAAELSVVVASIPEAVYIGTTAGFTMVNAVALADTQSESLEDLNRNREIITAEMQPRNVVTGEPIEPSQRTFARALRGETVIQDVLVADRRTRKDRVLRSAAGPVLVDGEVVAAVVVNTDITDHVAAEREAREARAQAEAANQSKSDFLAVMSHELRTPLNAIGGYVELLDLGIRGPVTPEQHTDLTRIQAAQRHLMGLVTDVLNFVRIDKGRVEYTLAEVAVEEVLTGVEVLVRPQFHAKKISYRQVPFPQLRVLADEEKLGQIFVNLLTNAIKFTPERGEVVVDCVESDEYAEISVKDTGIGIEPGKLEAIFEPFVQVNYQHTRANQGVGLGLAISRELARRMGGELSAASVVGVGSVFTVRLPRR
jgi:signal transduction histidine kinase